MEARRVIDMRMLRWRSEDIESEWAIARFISFSSLLHETDEEELLHRLCVVDSHDADARKRNAELVHLREHGYGNSGKSF